MCKLLTFFLIFQIIFFPFIALSQERVTTLQEGDKAPFDGTLFSVQAAAKLLTDLEFRKETCDLEKEKSLATQKSVFDLEISNLKSNLDFCKTTKISLLKIKDDQIDFLQKEIVKNDSTWPRVWLFVGGIVAGSLITIGAAYAVNSVAD